MKQRERFFLLRHFLKSQGFLFYAEIIATFIVFFIVTLVLSLMNGLQEKQFENIRNVSSFPLIIKNAEKSDYGSLLNLTECQTGEIRVYPYKDYKMLSKKSAKIATLRVGYSSYYSDEIFKNYFFVFPYASVQSGRIIHPYSTIVENDEYYYIKEGESGSAIIETLDVSKTDVYRRNAGAFDDIFYLSMGDFFETYDHFDIGLLGHDKAIAALQKKLTNNFNLSSYKEEVKDVYSALTIENAMLFLVMLFLLIVVFLSFEKSIRNLIFSKRSEVVMLRAFGKTRLEVFSLFLFTYSVPLILSEILSVIFASVLINSGALKKLFSNFGKIGAINSLSFIFDAKEITYMVFISFLIYLILVGFAVNSVSKISINEVTKE